MPKKRISSSKRILKTSPDVNRWLNKSLKMHSFLGVSLAGGKTEKTSLAVIEYYPEQNKIFLSHLIEKITSNLELSSDQTLYKLMSQNKKKIEMIALDVPIKLPKCLRCKLKCPGYEHCKEPEIVWLWNNYRERNKKKRPKKLFTPYTERCTEYYIANELEEKFNPPHALGANMAPLTARALFLIRRKLLAPVIEVNPKVSLWRIGRSLGIQKSHLRFHKASYGREEARTYILRKLMELDIAFLYEQDLKIMVNNNQAFEAFLCALTGVLKFIGEVEKRPKGFPRGEAWIEIPKSEIKWR